MIYVQRFHTPLGGAGYRDQVTGIEYLDSSYASEAACYSTAKSAALAVLCAQDGVRQESELRNLPLQDRKNLYRIPLDEQPYSNATSTLDGNINNSTTTIVLADASAFPAVGSYRILVDSETMQVVSRSSNTLTVRRAAEKSKAASHDNGAAVVRVLTAGALAAMAS